VARKELKIMERKRHLGKLILMRASFEILKMLIFVAVLSCRWLEQAFKIINNIPY